MTNRMSLREKANRAREYRCHNLIGVLEHPKDIRNIGTFVRNINALGVEKAYIVTDNPDFPVEWESMRNRHSLLGTSASAIQWTFVRVFPSTEACLQHLEDKGFASMATSPHQKGRDNVWLHEGDYTRFKRLAV
jgi:tRNA (guanosine-2'-O-)-methyltransferase